MDKKIKQNIQEALQAELRKEGIWDKYVADPISGFAQGVANIPRGIYGQMQLGSVNKKMERATQRIGKEWDEAERHALEKAKTMQNSKNQQVSSMGMEVQKNVELIDRAVQGTLQKLARFNKLGAQTKGAGQTSQFNDFLEKIGFDMEHMSKAAYERMFETFLDLVSRGIDPSVVPPENWLKVMRNTDPLAVINKAKELAAQGLLHGVEGLQTNQDKAKADAKAAKLAGSAPVPGAAQASEEDLNDLRQQAQARAAQRGFSPGGQAQSPSMSLGRAAEQAAQQRFSQTQRRPDVVGATPKPKPGLGSRVAQGAKDIGSEMSTKAKQYAAKQAGKAASWAGEKVKQGAEAAGSAAYNFADEMRQKGVEKLSKKPPTQSQKKPQEFTNPEPTVVQSPMGTRFQDEPPRTPRSWPQEPPQQPQEPETVDFDMPPEEVGEASPGALTDMFGLSPQIGGAISDETGGVDEEPQRAAGSMDQTVQDVFDDLDEDEPTSEPDMNLSSAIPQSQSPKIPKKIETDENGKPMIVMGDTEHSGTQIRPGKVRTTPSKKTKPKKAPAKKAPAKKEPAARKRPSARKNK